MTVDAISPLICIRNVLLEMKLVPVSSTSTELSATSTDHECYIEHRGAKNKTLPRTHFFLELDLQLLLVLHWFLALLENLLQGCKLVLLLLVALSPLLQHILNGTGSSLTSSLLLKSMVQRSHCMLTAVD